MGHCTAVAINDFIAEITSCYLSVLIILSMKDTQQVLSALSMIQTHIYYLFMALPAHGAGYLAFFVCLMAEFVPRQGTQLTGNMCKPKQKFQF